MLAIFFLGRGLFSLAGSLFLGGSLSMAGCPSAFSVAVDPSMVVTGRFCSGYEVVGKLCYVSSRCDFIEL